MDERLDKFLSKKHKEFSRNKIQRFISNGYVYVNGKQQKKVNFLINNNDHVDLKLENKINWVSRGAYKLLEALKIFKINLNGLICLDIGCSTGGFTHVMLMQHAKKIYAIDTGKNQFDSSILCDKIVLREKTNFLKTKQNDYDKIDFIACDTSFVSLTKIINHVNKIFTYPFIFVCLIKPQFELTKEILTKHSSGHIPISYHKKIIDKIYKCASNNNLFCSNVILSPILGAKKGNQEYLICMRKK